MLENCWGISQVAINYKHFLVMLVHKRYFAKQWTYVVGYYRILWICSWASSKTQLRSIWSAKLMAAKVGHECLSNQSRCPSNCPLVLLRSLECCTQRSETFHATWLWFSHGSKSVKMSCWISALSVEDIRRSCRGNPTCVKSNGLEFENTAVSLRAKQHPLQFWAWVNHRYKDCFFGVVEGECFLTVSSITFCFDFTTVELRPRNSELEEYCKKLESPS